MRVLTWWVQSGFPSRSFLSKASSGSPSKDKCCREPENRQLQILVFPRSIGYMSTSFPVFLFCRIEGISANFSNRSVIFLRSFRVFLELNRFICNWPPVLPVQCSFFVLGYTRQSCLVWPRLAFFHHQFTLTALQSLH